MSSPSENPQNDLSTRRLVIEAGKSERAYWADLWRYRELFWLLGWKEVVVRYKQSILGLSWAVFRPLVTIGVLSVIFGGLAEVETGGIPTPLIVATGQLPWAFFSQALTQSSLSLVNNAPLLTKVYMPRLILPASGVVTATVDFMISLAILVALMAYYGMFPGLSILLLPVLLLLVASTTMSISLWAAALCVKFRDVKHVIPFLVMIGMYVSPVAYRTDVLVDRLGSKLPAGWNWLMDLYYINPMVGVIDGFRWIFFDDVSLHLPGLLIAIVLTVILSFTGILYFRKVERSFADFV